ncbi:protein kinase-like domain, concanavalin A-like lectin/glucanase domain protein [Tanacetum coccineum]|uniref:Protein kinase-like domain, concanavalin A-like lectin/glucanase domain protein n=1 Tax=Tanacetum coccineum TaxID=301880 RepID=A0ABQ4YCE9_9ASTR
MQDDPSVNSSGSSSSTSMGAARELSSGRSTIKSAKICPLTDILGLYCMSYSPSSMLRFCNLPAISGFDSTCLIGWSVITTIGCAWKYLFSRLLACTKASTNFSTGAVFSIWKAFGGNTRDLGSFGEETYKTTNLHQYLLRISTQKVETASQITRDAVTTHLKMASQDFQTVEFLDPKKKEEIESWLGDSRIIDSLDGSNEIEYFDTFPTMEELEYHEWLLKYPKTSWVKAKIGTGNLNNVKISCKMGHFLKRQAYIDLESPINVMSKQHYNMIMSKGLESRKKSSNPSKNNNFVGRVKGLKVFIGNFTYECNFMILKDTTSIIDHHLGEVVFGKPFARNTGLVYDQEEGTITFEKNDEKSHSRSLIIWKRITI